MTIKTWRERAVSVFGLALSTQVEVMLEEIYDLRAALATARREEQERYAPIVALLKRYRKDTPLGHQPHMISGEVDDALLALKDEPAQGEG